VGHLLGLSARTQISVCKSPFPSVMVKKDTTSIPCENGFVETTDAEVGQHLVAGLWVRTLGES